MTGGFPAGFSASQFSLAERRTVPPGKVRTASASPRLSPSEIDVARGQGGERHRHGRRLFRTAGNPEADRCFDRGRGRVGDIRPDSRLSPAKSRSQGKVQCSRQPDIPRVAAGERAVFPVQLQGQARFRPVGEAARFQSAEYFTPFSGSKSQRDFGSRCLPVGGSGQNRLTVKGAWCGIMERERNLKFVSEYRSGSGRTDFSHRPFRCGSHFRSVEVGDF